VKQVARNLTDLVDGVLATKRFLIFDFAVIESAIESRAASGTVDSDTIERLHHAGTDVRTALGSSQRVELVAVDLEPVEELVGAGGKRAQQIVDSLLLIDDRLARRLEQRLGLS
jgi:hypothetical protein